MQQTLRIKALKGCGEQKAHLVPSTQWHKKSGRPGKGGTPVSHMWRSHFLPLLRTSPTHSPWGSTLTNWFFKTAATKLQKPKSPENRSGYWPAQQTTLYTSIQSSARIAGAFNANNSSVWLLQASPLLLLPFQKQFPVGLAFAAPAALRKGRCRSRQKHLWDGSDETVHHHSQHCQASMGSRGR